MTLTIRIHRGTRTRARKKPGPKNSTPPTIPI
jgi:hypothetical protein